MNTPQLQNPSPHLTSTQLFIRDAKLLGWRWSTEQPGRTSPRITLTRDEADFPPSGSSGDLKKIRALAKTYGLTARSIHFDNLTISVEILNRLDQ
jgi:hypothetical protein